MEYKVFIANDTTFDLSWLPNATRVHLLSNANLIILTGGDDINPKLYSSFTPSNENESPDNDRDIKEIHIIEKASKLNIPILGICRGAQMLTVMSGGELIQDVNQHYVDHELFIKNTKKIITVNSSHHQMMYPDRKLKMMKDYIPLAHSRLSISYDYYYGRDVLQIPNDFKEHEIIYYPKCNGLAVQFHPEYEESSHPSVQLVIELLNTYCMNKKLTL